MRFNGQLRDLGYHGRQGREEMKGEEEQRVCDDTCKDRLVSIFHVKVLLARIYTNVNLRAEFAPTT